MDILYIVGEGRSQCDNRELRYSLRSIEKYGKNIGRVFVAGYCPDFLSDKVIKVPFSQPYKVLYKEEYQARKHANILATILYVVDTTDISDEFLISMDDHIYIKDVNFGDYPFYMKNKPLPHSGNSEYKKLLEKTKLILENQRLPYYCFCPHRNMHLSRAIINECRDFLDIVVSRPIELEPFAYLNNYRLIAHNDMCVKAITDYKLKGGKDWYKANPQKTEVISTYDFKKNSSLDILIGGMFSKKSRYEK